jgi:hypothetical protein
MQPIEPGAAIGGVIVNDVMLEEGQVGGDIKIGPGARGLVARSEVRGVLQFIGEIRLGVEVNQNAAKTGVGMPFDVINFGLNGGTDEGRKV